MVYTILTKLLIISDTHGSAIQPPSDTFDVVIHCGDLTEESKMSEYHLAIEQLRRFAAPLKLVIAGNHDFTLDVPMFRKKLAAITPALDVELVRNEYGDFGEARQLFCNAQDDGIVMLDEGTHAFVLANGARLTVYASPYTPSLSDWGFQYDPQNEHNWHIDAVDISITHGPPRGLFDYTDMKLRVGSPSLFAAIARARPLVHCFGHIHSLFTHKLSFYTL